MRQSPKLTPII